MNDEPKSQTKLGQAIAGHLHVPWAIDRPCRAKWCYPVRIDGTTVVVRDSDCGLARPEMRMSMEEWEHCSSGGLWRMVGIFDFVRADDPAADDIAACHRSPDAMGRKIHDLREQLKTANKVVDAAKAVAEYMAPEQGDNRHTYDPEVRCQVCGFSTHDDEGEGVMTNGDHEGSCPYSALARALEAAAS